MTTRSRRYPAARLIPVLTLGWILAGPAIGLAQARDSTAASRWCFRPGMPPGRWFPITEAGLALINPRFSGPERIWYVGLARTLGRRGALGATLTVTDGDDFVTTVTLAPFGRLGLSHSLALDLTPGVVLHGRRSREFPIERPAPDIMIYSRAEGRAPAFAIDASLNLSDWIALFVRTSVFGYNEVQQSRSTLTVLPGVGSTWLGQPAQAVTRPGTIVNHWVGFRAGSYAGIGLGMLGVVATIVARGLIQPGS